MYIRFVKDIFDFTIAVFILLCATPLIVILMLILSIYNRGDVFFVQTRIGKDEKPFLIYKFKTMKDQLDQRGNLLSHEQRITKLGAVLRTFHLDELPNLINVLKGELSLVGPRPLLPEYLPYYNTIEKKRHLVKPGITGLAQVNGGNKLRWREKLKKDVTYINMISFYTDMVILLKTLIMILEKDLPSSNAIHGKKI